MRRFVITGWIMVLLAIVMFAAVALADNVDKYYLTGDDSVQKTDMDSGFQNGRAITDVNDVHYGWSLGKFYMKGYTEVIKEDGIPLFLVNAGDSITLSFELNQNINKLNNRDNWVITEDINGYDAEFGTGKTNLHHGALFIRYTDYQNNSVVTSYEDYLASAAGGTANTTISSLQEGKYEVALDYEVGTPSFPGRRCDNYRIRFTFQVRNSNCMIFLRDISSKSEMTNYAIAPEGFYLDYANSHYLSVIVKRDVLTKNDYGYSLNPRQCKAAKDGNEYTEPGIYTVTVKNNYTDESVEMTVGVGDDPITNAFVQSSCVYDPSQISEMVDSGKAVITEDWQVLVIDPRITESDLEQKGNSLEVSADDKGIIPDKSLPENPADTGSPENQTVNNNTGNSTLVTVLISCLAIILVAGVAYYMAKRRGGKK